MYHIYMTVGIALLVGSILFISLGLFGKISPDPFSNMKQFYAFMTIFLISGMTALINAQGVDCQIERYKTNLEHLSNKMMRSTLDCKMIGMDDLEKCPLMWEHYKKKDFYTKEIIRLTKLKMERQ